MIFFSFIFFIIQNTNKEEFLPSMVVDILPKLISSLAAEITSQKNYSGIISFSSFTLSHDIYFSSFSHPFLSFFFPKESILLAYSHILRLFLRYLDGKDNGQLLQKRIDKKIEMFLKGREKGGNKGVGEVEIGEMLVLLGLSENYSFLKEGEKKEVGREILEEFFVRKVGKVESYIKDNAVRTKTEEEIRREEDEEEERLRARGERELGEVKERAIRRRRREDKEELSGVESFVLKNYGRWKREEDFPPLSSPSPSPSPSPSLPPTPIKVFVSNITSPNEKSSLKWWLSFSKWFFSLFSFFSFFFLISLLQWPSP